VLTPFLSLAESVVVQPASGQPIAREGLVLEYRFEDDSTDTSGNKHDGAIHGSPQFASGEGRV
jgi:hypothetical protein